MLEANGLVVFPGFVGIHRQNPLLQLPRQRFRRIIFTAVLLFFSAVRLLEWSASPHGAQRRNAQGERQTMLLGLPSLCALGSPHSHPSAKSL